MKKPVLSLFFCAMTFLSLAQEQLLNASFENWTTDATLSYESPDNWWGTSVACTGASPVVCSATTVKTTDAHNGTYAAQLVNISGSNGTDKGQLLYMMSNLNYYSFSSRPTSLTGYYKFNKAGSDKITVSIVLTGSTESDFIGYGSRDLSTSTSAYTKFNVPVSYLSANAVQHILVSISFNDNPDLSSTFTVDDLNLTYATTATTYATPESSGVHFFPNPSAESIRFERTVTSVSVKTANGIEVLNSTDKTESLNISSLLPGVYILSYQYNDILIHTKLIKE